MKFIKKILNSSPSSQEDITRTYDERKGANKHDGGGGDEQNHHLDLRASQAAKAAAPAGIRRSARVSAERRAPDEAPVHPHERGAHQHVTHHRHQDQQRAASRVHERKRVRAHIGPPVDEAPGLRVLHLDLSKTSARQRAE